MKPTLNPIDKLVKKALTGHEVAPDADVWTRLSKELPSSEQPIGLPWYFKPGKVLMAGLLISALSFLGGYFFASLKVDPSDSQISEAGFISSPGEGQTQFINPESSKHQASQSFHASHAQGQDDLPKGTELVNGEKANSTPANQFTLQVNANRNESIIDQETNSRKDDNDLLDISSTKHSQALLLDTEELGLLESSGYPMADGSLPFKLHTMSDDGHLSSSRFEVYFDHFITRNELLKIDEDYYRSTNQRMNGISLLHSKPIGESGFYVTSGLGMHKMDMQVTDNYHYRVFVPDSIGSGGSIGGENGDNVQLRNYISTYSATRLSLPIGLRFEKSFNKLAIFAEAGPQLNYIHTNLTQSNRSKDGLDSAFQSNQHPETVYNSLSVQLNSGIGVAYAINDKMDIAARATLFTDIRRSLRLEGQKANNVSASLGLRYRL